MTQENKREFVQLSAQYRLYSSIKNQIESLSNGFYEIIPKDLITIVRESQLWLFIISSHIPSYSSMNKSLSYSSQEHLTLMSMNGEQQQSIVDTTALIRTSSGGGEHSNLSIVMSVLRSSVLPRALHECLSVVLWTCKASKACRDFRSTRHMGHQTVYPRHIHVRSIELPLSQINDPWH